MENSGSQLLRVPPEYVKWQLEEFMVLAKEIGFSREDLLSMPVWERKFYLQTLKEIHED